MRSLLATLMFAMAATAAAALTPAIDTGASTQPIGGFIFSNQGLICGPSFAGPKIAGIAR